MYMVTLLFRIAAGFLYPDQTRWMKIWKNVGIINDMINVFNDTKNNCCLDLRGSVMFCLTFFC